MAALALVLVGTALVHSIEDPFNVFNTSTPCPESCNCSWESGGGLSGAVCTSPMLDDFALGGNLRALELQGCDGAKWGEMGFLENLTMSNCRNNSLLSDFHNVKHLQRLAVSRSSLPSNLPCSLLSSLSHLSITSTNLSSLAVLKTCGSASSLPLTHLDLSDNQFTSLDWSDLEIFPGLEELNLGQNSMLASMSPPTHPFGSLSRLNLAGTSSLLGLCDSVVTFLPSLEYLDLTESSLTSLPPKLLLLENFTTFIPPSHTLHCSCQLTLVIQEEPDSIFNSLQCMLPDGQIIAAPSPSILTTLSCSPPSLSLIQPPSTLAFEAGLPLTLDCPITGSSPPPTLLWLSPRLELLRLRPEKPECSKDKDELILGKDLAAYSRWPGHLTILSNGSLMIDQFGWRDRGEYICYVDNLVGNASVSFTLELKAGYRDILYYWSILFGFVTAVCFLMVTLAGKLLHHLLWNYGCCSCCCGGQAPRTRKLTTMVESIEAYRIQQLEKLRENYQNNSQRIRDNYTLQVEKMREHYSSSRGASQVASESYQNVKDQYWDQVTKMREYSNAQLAKSHENYIFQRQRLRKFSAQNYLKIRETGKYTHKTLNRVLENMPAVSDLTSCRQGQVPDWDNQRDMELHPIEEVEDFEGIESLHLGEGDSVYFTPSGTPLREGTGNGDVKGRRTHKRMVSNLSNFLPFWWGMGQTDSVETHTVAIVEPTPNKESETEGDLQIVLDGQELDEVVITGGEQVAPLAQEEENLSICDEDFATPEAISPINLQETVALFTSFKQGRAPDSPESPMDKTIIPVADYINGIQRCESPVETSHKTF